VSDYDRLLSLWVYKEVSKKSPNDHLRGTLKVKDFQWAHFHASPHPDLSWRYSDTISTPFLALVCLGDKVILFPHQSSPWSVLAIQRYHFHASPHPGLSWQYSDTISSDTQIKTSHLLSLLVQLVKGPEL